LLLVSRCPLRQHTRFREQRREQQSRVNQLDTVFAKHVGHGADQTIRVSRRELHQDRKKRPVWNDAPEDLGVLHLPSHDGRRYAGLLQQVDTRAKLPERNPVDWRGVPMGSRIQLGERFFLDRDDRDLVSQRACRVEHEKRKSPVASEKAQLHDVPGSRFPVPCSCSRFRFVVRGSSFGVPRGTIVRQTSNPEPRTTNRNREREPGT
jgi:hypothetical protein